MNVRVHAGTMYRRNCQLLFLQGEGEGEGGGGKNHVRETFQYFSYTLSAAIFVAVQFLQNYDNKHFKNLLADTWKSP